MYIENFHVVVTFFFRMVVTINSPDRSCFVPGGNTCSHTVTVTVMVTVRDNLLRHSSYRKA
jgi:hypothetical protein